MIFFRSFVLDRGMPSGRWISRTFAHCSILLVVSRVVARLVALLRIVVDFIERCRCYDAIDGFRGRDGFHLHCLTLDLILERKRKDQAVGVRTF